MYYNFANVNLAESAHGLKRATDLHVRLNPKKDVTTRQMEIVR